jgi:hypothetical protein
MLLHREIGLYKSKESGLLHFGIKAKNVVLNATNTLPVVLDSFITLIKSSSIISLNPRKKPYGPFIWPKDLVFLETVHIQLQFII